VLSGKRVHSVWIGIPTERLLAGVVVGKFAWHNPLYPQAQIMRLQGFPVDRSTPAFSSELKPIYLPVLRYRQGRPGADRPRGAGTNRGALCHREPDPRPQRGGAPCRPPGGDKTVGGKLQDWLETKLIAVSEMSTIASAIRYGLSRWDGLVRFLADGRIELDTNWQSDDRTLSRRFLNHSDNMLIAYLPKDNRCAVSQPQAIEAGCGNANPEVVQ
jgi:Transposase IS66 family